MGPILLLDKSGLQALPRMAYETLSRHYYLVVPPILVTEIQADLNKKKQGGAQFVRTLSEKIGTTQFFVNMGHPELRVYNLLGRKIEMATGQPIVDAREFNTIVGTAGLILDTKESDQLLNWRFEKTSSDDEQAAKDWRELFASIDLENRKRKFKAENNLPRIETFEQLGSFVNAIFKSENQRTLLEMCITDAVVDEDIKSQIRHRWENGGPPRLHVFAPYAFFCLRIRMLFHVGLASDLISTRASNLADLEYLYYAPFCHAFSSNDEFHADLAPLVLRPDQYFIRTRDLWRDLDSIAYFWDTLSHAERVLWFRMFGHWPPRAHTSFTYRTWRRTMRPHARPRRTKDNAQLNEDVKRVMQAYQDIQNQIRTGHRL